MKIALVASDLSGAGAQRVLVELARAWAERDHDLFILTTHQVPDAYTLPQGVSRITLDALTDDVRRRAYEAAKREYELSRDWSRIGAYLLEDAHVRRGVERLRAELAAYAPDAVISFGGAANLMSVIACSSLDGPRVVVREGNDPNRFSITHMSLALRRFAAANADHVVCNTRSASRWFETFTSAPDVVYIPNPVSPVSASPLKWTEPTILTVGRLSPQKDHETLLSAFAQASLGRWRLAVVGEGELEPRLRQSAGDLGIAAKVDWYGFVADPFAFYRSAQIFVLPSRFEGLPNALLEAMSFALPCIVSDGSEGPAEIVSDEDTGLVIRAGDSADLSKALVRLAGDAELRSRLGANARRAVQRFSLANVVARWDRLLGTACGAAR